MKRSFGAHSVYEEIGLFFNGQNNTRCGPVLCPCQLTNDGALFPCAIAITYLFSRAPCALRNRGQDEIRLGEPGSAVMSTGVLTSASMT